MKNTRIRVSDKAFQHYSGSLAVVFVDDQKNITSFLDKQIKKKIKYVLQIGDFTGKKEESLIMYPDNAELRKGATPKRILLVGIGDVGGNDFNSLRETLRCAGGIIAQTAKNVKAEEMLVVLPDYLKNVSGTGAEEIVEGILLGDYQFVKYKKREKDKSFGGIKTITVGTQKNISGVRKAVKAAQNVSEATLVARDMANEPGNKWRPQDFAAFAQSLARQYSLTCSVMGSEEMKRIGLGGILGVSQGSAVPPKLIILEYTPKKYSKTILLVGKGLTFDSGGISIKPAAGMQDMKYDMCGGAAVLSTMQAIAREKPAVQVIAMVPSSENLSGAMAIKPGDIIKHYNGITSEIVNTDAEGRLILADALAYGVETYKPHCVIDLATLTGAVIIGLGHHRTGLMSNNDHLAEKLYESGALCGEPMWRLPLGEDYTKQIESEVADIKNIGGRDGGSITAAAYLEKFVGDTPWAHLDIAGTAWDFTKKSYIPKGPSGIGVRTLMDFVRNWKKTV